MREEKRVPRLTHDRMRDERVREECERMTSEKMEDLEWEGESDEWGNLAEVMVDTAKEVCGEERGRASNPLMVGREDELGALHQAVNVATERRNECAVRMRVRRRLRGREKNENLRRIEREWEEER